MNASLQFKIFINNWENMEKLFVKFGSWWKPPCIYIDYPILSLFYRNKTFKNTENAKNTY